MSTSQENTIGEDDSSKSTQTTPKTLIAPVDTSTHPDEHKSSFPPQPTCTSVPPSPVSISKIDTKGKGKASEDNFTDNTKPPSKDSDDSWSFDSDDLTPPSTNQDLNSDRKGKGKAVETSPDVKSDLKEKGKAVEENVQESNNSAANIECPPYLEFTRPKSPPAGEKGYWKFVGGNKNYPSGLAWTFIKDTPATKLQDATPFASQIPTLKDVKPNAEEKGKTIESNSSGSANFKGPNDKPLFNVFGKRLPRHECARQKPPPGAEGGPSSAGPSNYTPKVAEAGSSSTQPQRRPSPSPRFPPSDQSSKPRSSSTFDILFPENDPQVLSNAGRHRRSESYINQALRTLCDHDAELSQLKRAQQKASIQMALDFAESKSLDRKCDREFEENYTVFRMLVEKIVEFEERFAGLEEVNEKSEDPDDSSSSSSSDSSSSGYDSDSEYQAPCNSRGRGRIQGRAFEYGQGGPSGSYVPRSHVEIGGKHPSLFPPSHNRAHASQNAPRDSDYIQRTEMMVLYLEIAEHLYNCYRHGDQPSYDPRIHFRRLNPESLQHGEITRDRKTGFIQRVDEENIFYTAAVLVSPDTVEPHLHAHLTHMALNQWTGHPGDILARNLALTLDFRNGELNQQYYWNLVGPGSNDLSQILIQVLHVNGEVNSYVGSLEGDDQNPELNHQEWIPRDVVDEVLAKIANVIMKYAGVTRNLLDKDEMAGGFNMRQIEGVYYEPGYQANIPSRVSFGPSRQDIGRAPSPIPISPLLNAAKRNIAHRTGRKGKGKEVDTSSFAANPDPSRASRPGALLNPHNSRSRTNPERRFHAEDIANAKSQKQRQDNGLENGKGERIITYSSTMAGAWAEEISPYLLTPTEDPSRNFYECPPHGTPMINTTTGFLQHVDEEDPFYSPIVCMFPGTPYEHSGFIHLMTLNRFLYQPGDVLSRELQFTIGYIKGYLTQTEYWNLTIGTEDPKLILVQTDIHDTWPEFRNFVGSLVGDDQNPVLCNVEEVSEGFVDDILFAAAMGVLEATPMTLATLENDDSGTLRDDPRSLREALSKENMGKDLANFLAAHLGSKKNLQKKLRKLGFAVDWIFEDGCEDDSDDEETDETDSDSDSENDYMRGHLNLRGGSDVPPSSFMYENHDDSKTYGSHASHSISTSDHESSYSTSSTTSNSSTTTTTTKYRNTALVKAYLTNRLTQEEYWNICGSGFHKHLYLRQIPLLPLEDNEWGSFVTFNLTRGGIAEVELTQECVDKILEKIAEEALEDEDESEYENEVEAESMIMISLRGGLGVPTTSSQRDTTPSRKHSLSTLFSPSNLSSSGFDAFSDFSTSSTRTPRHRHPISDLTWTDAAIMLHVLQDENETSWPFDSWAQAWDLLQIVQSSGGGEGGENHMPLSGALSRFLQVREEGGEKGVARRFIVGEDVEFF